MNVKNDTGTIRMLCYLGILVLLIFIIIPPLFRVLYPKEEVIEEEPLPIIMNLACSKTDDFGDYQLTNTITTNYYDDTIHDSVFSYIINENESGLPEGVVIEEYEALKNIPNVIANENGNTYTLSFDFYNYNYGDEELLANHIGVLAVQRDYYSQNGFECTVNQVQ